ncbi:MAG: transcription antitermination factor NusB [Nitrospiraceae bacterium]|jgi:transcription antitermination protein NusB|nr:MAG: transcription antitermination factor NusB [Nitrospiraceae bacterium]
MNRRRAREYALQMLFQHDFVGERSSLEFEGERSPDKKTDADVKKFAGELVTGTLKHLEEIDKVVQEAAEHWKMERMAAVDRNILRCAVYEIIYRSDIPAAVTINEALEIAKKYSSLESVSFINGLLDKIAHIHAKSK